jgi:hypothetical protein
MNRDTSQKIELTTEQAEALLQRAEQQCFLEQDYPIVFAIMQNYFAIGHVMQEKTHTIMRLLNRCFGHRTEKSRKVFAEKHSTEAQRKTAKEKPKGHGRNGASAYTGAKKVCVPHPTFKAGDRCPLCPKGKLYPYYQQGTLVRVVGRAPMGATVYELEKLRCNLCGELMSAEAPEEAGDEKYDETASSMVALLKYGCGMPFNRLEKLQDSFGIPLAASTQWDLAEKAGNKIYPAYNELICQAAQGKIIHNDDTTARILSEMKNEKPDKEDASRKGTFTTGMLSVTDKHKIALFFTGHNHAGENMDKLLGQRASGLDPPIQMCDALSRNEPQEFKTILANCLSHARRHFVDLVPSFPEQCRYVIDAMAEVYRHDQITKTKGMSDQQRLTFHQTHSGPIMEKLKEWLEIQLDEKLVEPNSSMGKAINYMRNHWDPLTLFLRVPGAPLDNNICERALKLAILNRKNAFFFKTEHGAYIGDLFMSLIHTCNLNRVNPFHYLTALQKHSSELFTNPKQWLPWNYTLAISDNS